RTARLRSAPASPRISAWRLRALPPCHRAAWRAAYSQERRRRVIRVFLIAASQLARAALQNRLKAPSVKIVGTADSVDPVGRHLSDSQADVLLVDAAGESPEAIIESLADSDLAAEIPVVVL